RSGIQARSHWGSSSGYRARRHHPSGAHRIQRTGVGIWQALPERVPAKTKTRYLSFFRNNASIQVTRARVAKTDPMARVHCKMPTIVFISHRFVFGVAEVLNRAGRAFRA